MTNVDALLALAQRISAATQAADKPARTRASKTQKARVWKRAGGVCEGCGGAKSLRVHHVVPACRGGTNSLGNLKLYCEFCERRDHRRAGIT